MESRKNISSLSSQIYNDIWLRPKSFHKFLSKRFNCRPLDGVDSKVKVKVGSLISVMPVGQRPQKSLTPPFFNNLVDSFYANLIVLHPLTPPPPTSFGRHLKPVLTFRHRFETWLLSGEEFPRLYKILRVPSITCLPRLFFRLFS